MKLLGFILPSGDVCGKDVQSWNESDLSGHEAFKRDLVGITGYQDISSIENWNHWGQNAGNDYLQQYKEIASLVYAKILGDWVNWGNLTAGEQSVALAFCIPPYSIRQSNPDDKKNWDVLVFKTKLCRVFIIESMREAVADYQRTEQMTKADGDLFYTDTAALLLSYENTNNNGFKQWLMNEPGSIYEFNGFAQKVYYTVERRDVLKSICIDLIY